MLNRIPRESKPWVRILQRLTRCWKVKHNTFLSINTCNDYHFWRVFYQTAKWGKSSAVFWTEKKSFIGVFYEDSGQNNTISKQFMYPWQHLLENSPAWAQCTHLFLHMENHIVFSLPEVSDSAAVMGYVETGSGKASARLSCTWGSLIYVIPNRCKQGKWHEQGLTFYKEMDLFRWKLKSYWL